MQCNNTILIWIENLGVMLMSICGRQDKTAGDTLQKRETWQVCGLCQKFKDFPRTDKCWSSFPGHMQFQTLFKVCMNHELLHWWTWQPVVYANFMKNDQFYSSCREYKFGLSRHKWGIWILSELLRCFNLTCTISFT